ncbi:glyoxylate/hydroxypyruvate reductase A [Rhodoligotrophos appendicifer]|uniref:2-hydroxyacid dehydrogenase n=1 Tax=Rhodoligotrophos appendicifer TaxID=987056 RepID=UPI00117ED791|nr:glyoxylate/hydroxypyruvate reductase A [Rhodoligotrophos appendicifer]
MAVLYIAQGWDLAPWQEAIEQQAPDREARIWPDYGDPTEIDYALVWKPPHGVFKTFPNLKGIFNLGAGVDHLMADRTLPDIPIGRIIDPNMTMRMTEYVVLQVLLHHRQQLLLSEAQRSRKWASINQPAAADVRVGVMGLGVLGGDAAEKLRQLGFRVAGWSRTAKQLAGIECFCGAEQFTAFLNRTDIVVCLLPHTPETEGLLNADAFKALAKDGPLAGPVLINAGRGKVHVETDILHALESDDLHAVSLDVFEQEPLDPGSPLWSHPRAVITPHIASDSDPKSLTTFILRQMKRIEAKKEIEARIDLAQGY